MQGPNELAPGKRPLHTLSTVIIEGEGGVEYALGTSGGHFRPQQHLLLITNLLDYSMDPVDAVDAPRFLWDGSSLIVEEGFMTGPEGARVVEYPSRTGVASVLAIRDGWRMLYTDPRGDGIALGQ
jgi:gamma-glutamyltranspeptidase/glutathione hydrolase